jgi:hypothetical protein
MHLPSLRSLKPPAKLVKEERGGKPSTRRGFFVAFVFSQVLLLRVFKFAYQVSILVRVRAPFHSKCGEKVFVWKKYEFESLHDSVLLIVHLYQRHKFQIFQNFPFF